MVVAQDGDFVHPDAVRVMPKIGPIEGYQAALVVPHELRG